MKKEHALKRSHNTKDGKEAAKKKPFALFGESKKRYILIYTCFFIVVSGGVFIWYYAAGRTFIWQSDGWNQHYKALVYYGKYLRSIARNLLSGNGLVIPTWDFSIGEGSDVLSALHFYVLGDPLNLLSVFVPSKYMWMLYDFLILLRLYLSGLFFSLLCFETKIKNRYGILAGALTYAFCAYALINAARHPHFLNPMVYLPLLILGIEKIIAKKRPWVFIAALFVSMVSSFYWLYMLALTVIIYVVVRLILLYRHEPKEGLKTFLKIAVCVIFGLALAAVIVFPVSLTFIDSNRMSAENGSWLLYPLSYYSRLASSLVSTSGAYWLYMGYSVVTVPALFLLFYKRKKNGLLKWLFLIGVVIMCIPTLGQVFNGFSYITNRWCWAFALLCAYILSKMWPELMALKRKEARFLILMTAGYLAVCLMLEYSRTEAAFLSMAVIALLLFLLLPSEKKGQPFFSLRYRQLAVLAVVILSILINSFYKNAYSQGNYASESMTVDEVSELLDNETKAVKSAASSEDDTSFYRYSGRSITDNADMLVGISSTQYNLSIANSYVSEFRTLLGLRENMLIRYDGYDDRTALLSLAGVKYYVLSGSDTAPVPYGFTYVKTVDVTEDDTEQAIEDLKEELGVDELTEAQIEALESSTSTSYKVYTNEYALPLGYTYDISVSEEEWEALDEVEKQEALLSAVVVEEDAADSDLSSLELTSEEFNYMVTCSSEQVTRQGNSFVVTQANASVTLTFEGLTESETYLIINGLNYEGCSTYDLYLGDDAFDPLNLYNETNWELLSEEERESITRSNTFWVESTSLAIKVKSSSGVSKTLNYYTPYYEWYENRHDFAINLDYSEDAVTSITITFPSIGIYSFDSISVACEPMEGYEDQITALSEDTLEDLEFGTNTVTGTISLDEDKWLCLSIPYSAGWTAYVDGKEAELYQANIQYMALKLEAGDHTIELVYKTPLLKAGAGVSAAALVLTPFVVFFYERRKRRSAKQRGDDRIC